MSDDYRLKLFLDMWQADVASGKTVSALHDWSKQHNAEDDTRFEVLTAQINGLREDLARQQGRVEGEREARQSFTNEVQTGRHLIPTPEQLEAARLQYAAQQPLPPHPHPIVSVNVNDRRHSHRPSALPPAVTKVLSSGIAKGVAAVLLIAFGVLGRHCAPGLVDAVQHPPSPPALEPHK